MCGGVERERHQIGIEWGKQLETVNSCFYLSAITHSHEISHNKHAKLDPRIASSMLLNRDSSLRCPDRDQDTIDSRPELLLCRTGP